MNHREPPHLRVGTRRALRCIALVLLPAFAPDGAWALPRTRPLRVGAGLGDTGPKPYLPVTGAPPLRFQEPLPPPDLVTRPPAAAPPTPALTPTEASVAEANAAAARSTTVTETPAATQAPATPDQPDKVETPAPPAKTPQPILRDEVRPTVRPEDFLPYFQIPGSAQKPSDVTLLVPAPTPPPAPATLPPSSATYTQSPR